MVFLGIYCRNNRTRNIITASHKIDIINMTNGGILFFNISYQRDLSGIKGFTFSK